MKLTQRPSDTDRVAEYEMKLMDIDTDTLGIPDTEYDCKVTMPSAEFARICRELAQLGESVRIEVNKEGIRFASEGDIANGSVLMKPTDGAHNRYEKERKASKLNGAGSSKPKVKKEKDAEEDADMEEEGGSIKEDDEEEVVEKPAKVSDNEEEAPKESESESEEEAETRKRKRKAASDKAKSSKKARKGKDGDSDDEENAVSIAVTQAVSLSFSLKYLINFSKSTGLCPQVELKLSADVPLLVS